MNVLNGPIRLRGHHLLCIQGFQGYGYNRVFIDNISRIISEVEKDPSIEIEVKTACDDICLQCPHRLDDICKKEPGADEKIQAMDKKVLEITGLEKGNRYNITEILDTINSSFSNRSDAGPVCGDCEWKKECLWYVALD